MYVCMVPWDGLMPYQDVFLPCAQCFWDRLWIHHGLTRIKCLLKINERNKTLRVLNGNSMYFMLCNG